MYEFCLPTSAKAVPDGPDWLHEIKYDGFRLRVEIRLLEQLAGNATLASAAKALGVSQETARTHLAHIFSKTGVSRQADLLTLLNRLMPPIRRTAR
jgi:DNA-binding CsgD family transcriptional regulator